MFKAIRISLVSILRVCLLKCQHLTWEVDLALLPLSLQLSAVFVKHGYGEDVIVNLVSSDREVSILDGSQRSVTFTVKIYHRVELIIFLVLEDIYPTVINISFTVPLTRSLVIKICDEDLGACLRYLVTTWSA